MGIRFACARCHGLLNVKDEMAGRRGRCPKCKNEIGVPQESQFSEEEYKQKLLAGQSKQAVHPAKPHSATHSASASIEQSGQSGTAHQSGAAHRGSQQTPKENTATPVARRPPTPPSPDATHPSPIADQNASPLQSGVPKAVPVNRASSDAEQGANARTGDTSPTADQSHLAEQPDLAGGTDPAGSAIPGASSSGLEPLDPIEASPDKIWYVRPPSGGQFGPASGTLLRKWIREDRVGPRAFVWQEGWPDWELACHVFPEYAKFAGGLAGGVQDGEFAHIRGQPMLPQHGLSNPIPDSATARARLLRRRRRQTAIWIAIMIFGSLVLVGLVVALVLVLNNIA